MFIATDVNGKLFIEAQNSKIKPTKAVQYVQSWDDIPQDIILASVTITDNQCLSRTLSGYAKYLVYREKAAKLVCGVSKVARMSSITNTAQVLVAVNNRSTAYKGISAATQELINGFPETGSPLIRTTRKALLKAKEDLLLKYRNATTAIIRLGFSEGYVENSGQSDKAFREGVVTNDGTPSVKAFKDELTRMMEAYLDN